MRVLVAAVATVAVFAKTPGIAVGDVAPADPGTELEKRCRGYKTASYQVGEPVPGGHRLPCPMLARTCDSVLSMAASPLADRCKALTPPSFRKDTAGYWGRCNPDDFAKLFEQARWAICLGACQEAGKKGVAYEQLRSQLDRRRRRRPSMVLSDFDKKCEAKWKGALSTDAQGDLSQCEPKREVLAYARSLEAQSRRLQNGVTSEPQLPQRSPGLPVIYKNAARPDRKRWLTKHKELLEKVSLCPQVGSDIRPLAKKLQAKVLAELSQIAEEERKEQEAEAKRQAELAAIKADATPKIRKLLSCARCTDEVVWKAFESAVMVCESITSRQVAQAELRQLKSYGRRHGVVDLSELKDKSDEIRDLDETNTLHQGEFRKLTKRQVPTPRCKGIVDLVGTLRKQGITGY